MCFAAFSSARSASYAPIWAASLRASALTSTATTRAPVIAARICTAICLSPPTPMTPQVAPGNSASRPRTPPYHAIQHDKYSVDLHRNRLWAGLPHLSITPGHPPGCCPLPDPTASVTIYLAVFLSSIPINSSLSTHGPRPLCSWRLTISRSGVSSRACHACNSRPTLLGFCYSRRKPIAACWCATTR